MRRAAWLSILLITCLVRAGYGQTLTGTILGTVTDTSGAVLPGASVTITHTDTNQQRVVATSESGTYSAPHLPVGTYQVEASVAGFQTERVSGVLLQIGEDRRVDIELNVGEVTLVVEVVADDPLMQTDESSLGSVIDQETIEGLPLNGRRFETLALLLPGSVNAAQGSEIGSRGGFNVSGYDENFNTFFLDGFDNVDPVLRNVSFRPSVDLIQEFSVLQNSYKAEFGRNAGAVINATTRSGTNALHGSVWEFHRNDNLDARNAFATEGAKPDLLRNQFGAALGGPIQRNRTFFFVAYEGLREKSGETHRAFVPTERMRRGDFGELASPVIDPTTGQPFSGNVIPEDRWHPITSNAIAAYPQPNVTGAGLSAPNRLEIANAIDDADDISARVDTRLWTNTQLMARYSFSNSRVLDPFRNGGAGSGTDLKDFGQTNDIIRTNTGVGFTTVIDPNLVHEFRFGYNRFKQPQVPIRALPSEQAALAGTVRKFLNFQPAGFAELGSGTEFRRVVNVYNYIDQMSWTRGDHQFKFGVDVRRYLFNASSAFANQFVFDGTQTGHGMADMLLGLPASTLSVGGDPAANLRKTEAAAYIQDDWKLTPSLTLNLGIRYEWYGRIIEKNNRQSNWDPVENRIVIAGEDVSRSMVDDDYNNFAPRVGLALRPFSDNTVIRAGYGIFYDNQMRHNYLQVGYPFVIRQQFLSAPGMPLSMDDPFPTGEGSIANLIPFGLEVDYRDSYAQHWNLGVQHEIVRNTVLDVAYVGNHFVKLTRTRWPNQPIEGTFPPVFPFSPPDVPFAPGPFLFIVLQEQAGSSNYHALQVRVEGRPMSRLSFISSYTWGHAIDDRPAQADASTIGGLPFPQNSHNPGLDRASADFDVRHRYNLSFMYGIPGSGRAGLAGHVLDGWSLRGILTLQSGRPFTVGLPRIPFGIRPDAVEGVDPVPADQGPDHWINADAFSVPEGVAHGNLGRNTMTGPGFQNFDFSVVKDFRVDEGRTLQFRSEFFNLTNHPNFGLPNQVFGTPDFGVISSTVGNERQIQFGLRYEF